MLRTSRGAFNKRIRKCRIRRGLKSYFNFEGAAFGQSALSSCGFGEDVFAVVAGDHCLGMAEDHGCFVATSALHVHEV
jgi:hypothetical protein